MKQNWDYKIIKSVSKVLCVTIYIYKMPNSLLLSFKSYPILFPYNPYSFLSEKLSE